MSDLSTIDFFKELNPETVAAKFLSGKKSAIYDEILMKKNADESDDKSLKNKKVLSEDEIKERDNRTLMIDNVPSNIDKKIIKKMAKEYGEIESIRIRGLEIDKNVKVNKKIAAITKKFNQESTCIVYVVFKDIDSCNKAIEGMNGHKIGNNTIETDRARQKGAKIRHTKEENMRSVFVGQIGNKVTPEDLRELFSVCGEIEHVKVKKDPVTGMSRNIAFIVFKEEKSVNLALRFNKTEFKGREINVEKSNPGKALKNKLNKELKSKKKGALRQLTAKGPINTGSQDSSKNKSGKPTYMGKTVKEKDADKKKKEAKRILEVIKMKTRNKKKPK